MSIAEEHEKVANKPPDSKSNNPLLLRSLYAREARSNEDLEGAYFGGSNTMTSNFCCSSANTFNCLFTSDWIATCASSLYPFNRILRLNVSIAKAELSTEVTLAAPSWKAFKVKPPE
ncbi:hypothetical protein D3C86_1779750 [compost metagenome]